jgi:hypothetical protein
MENISESISVKFANAQRITESDVKGYLISINMNPVEVRECSDVFLRYHNMSRDEFQKCDKAEKDWFGQMFMYIHDYKQKMNVQYIMKNAQPFETDISKYTNNKSCIEHFRGAYTQIWLSLTDTEKKQIVSNFEGQITNKGASSYKQDENFKTSSQKKIDAILGDRKRNEKSLDDFES